MSLRAALVDDLKTVTAVTDIAGDRITDMSYEFEDFLNSSANSVSKFPAVSIEADNYEPDFWEQKKAELEQKAIVDIKKGFSDILGKYGIEIK